MVTGLCNVPLRNVQTKLHEIIEMLRLRGWFREELSAAMDVIRCYLTWHDARQIGQREVFRKGKLFLRHFPQAHCIPPWTYFSEVTVFQESVNKSDIEFGWIKCVISSAVKTVSLN